MSEARTLESSVKRIISEIKQIESSNPEPTEITRNLKKMAVIQISAYIEKSIKEAIYLAVSKPLNPYANQKYQKQHSCLIILQRSLESIMKRTNNPSHSNICSMLDTIDSGWKKLVEDILTEDADFQSNTLPTIETIVSLRNSFSHSASNANIPSSRAIEDYFSHAIKYADKIKNAIVV